MRNIAVDVHKEKLVLCEVRDGRVIANRTGKSLSDLDRWIGPGTEPARIAYEACRGAWYLHDELKTRGHHPIILDTTRIRMLGVGQHGRKNDKIDAEVMARALEKGYVHPAHVLSPSRREMRRVLAIRYGFVSARTQHINIVRGLAMAEGVSIPSCDGDDFASHARAASWPSSTASQLEPVFEMIEQSTRSIHDTTRTLHEICAREPVVTLLATLPFVGLITAATFVSVIDDAGRFRNGHCVASYLGLVPSENTSNSVPRLGSITKAGNKWARVALVEAAWGLLERGNPEDPLVLWGREIKARRHTCIAAVAMARKLASILWAMWKYNRTYDPHRLASASCRGLHEHANQVLEQRDVMASKALDPTREKTLLHAQKKLRRSYVEKLSSPKHQGGTSTN